MKTYLNLLVLTTFLFVGYETEVNDIDINYKANIDLNMEPPVLNFDATHDDEDIRDGLDTMANGTTVNFTSGVTYDIDVDIIIEDKSNITINGNNVTFRYITDGVRFKIDNSSTIVIKDLIVDNHTYNTNAEGGSGSHTGRIIVNNSSSYVTLDNIEMTAQKGRSGATQAVHQILIEKSDHITVKNCDLEESSGELVHLLASTDCLVEDNRMEGGWSGVGTAGILDGGQEVYGIGNDIIGNTIRHATTAYITINDRGALVKGNNLKDSLGGYGGPGIRFGHKNGTSEYEYASKAKCTLNIIDGLLVNNNPSGNYEAVAIKVDYTQTTIGSNGSDGNYSDLLIEDNTITNCKIGVKVSNQPGQYLTIKENSIQTTDQAIELFSPDLDKVGSLDQQKPHECLVEENTLLKSNSNVIKIYNSSMDLKNNDDIVLASNDEWHKAVIIGHDTSNFLVDFSNDIEITGNTFDLNGDLDTVFSTGIYYFDANIENMSISNNTINNGYIGIYVGGENTSISNNTMGNFKTWPIYIVPDSANTSITFNDVTSSEKSCVYLLNTSGSTVQFNDFEKTGSLYPYAVWKSGTNSSCTVSSNTLTNFTNQSN